MLVPPHAAVLMVLATALWGGHYLLAGVASASMTPFELTLLRWMIAVVPLVVIAQLVEKPDWRRVLRAWPRLLLLAGLGMVGYNLFLYAALDFTTSIGASIVNAANPATMALLAALITREKLRGSSLTGIAISLVGVLFVVSGGSVESLLALDVNAGQLLMVGAVVVWSLYSIWGRVEGVPPITSTAAQAVLVVAVMAPFAPVAEVQLPTDPAAIVALLYIGILPSVGSYVLWNMALRTTPSGVAAIFLNLITVATVVIGAVLGQAVLAAELVGGLVIIAGVLVTSWPGRAEDAAAAPLVAERRRRFPARWARRMVPALQPRGNGQI